MSEHHELPDRRLARTPIAIVGMSGLFPMARNHREYWQNIVDGVDCTSDVPASRWSLDDYYDADPAAPDKTYSRRGAFLPDVDFDPLEFGLPPNQLDVTSTMQTLSLGVARDLLRDAGAAGDSAGWYDPARTGVVLGTTGPVPLMHPLAARLSTPVLKEVVRSCGLSGEDADAIADKYVQAFAPWEENSFPGLLANVVAGRVANRLGLGGMNSTVDAACAASLSALRTAIAELVDGRADTMITGGVDTENSIFIYLCFSKVGALSKAGTIRPFDDNADGTLLGEGIGMLALRRLADAERDGNRIYAVIRGLGSSSDGRSKSIYAPRAEGQQVALERAYADAEVSPASVELFEAHATGTAVGDRTELTALGEVIGAATEERGFAALGSVKSQIGHTKGAAGTASLMKLALGLHHKVLPPTINVEEPNRVLGTEAPFYVNVKTRPWIRDPHRPVRRAAASAMGFGGTNFHVVLEEHDPARGPVLHRSATAYLWHAPDTTALTELIRSGAAGTDGPVPAEHARAGFVAVDDAAAAELRELLVSALSAEPEAGAWSHPRGVWFRRSALPDLKVGALFAGQGSQYLEMGLDAALNNPVVGNALDEANAVFEGHDVRLAQVVFPAPVFDPEERQRQEAALRRTEYAQPAIGALSAGQFRFLSELGLRCDGFLGHSFGELTALWAAGSLSDVDFFSLAKARGTAMAPGEGDAGTMAAVSASREEVVSLLDGFSDVVVCNHNAPDQVVLGGATDAIERFVDFCGSRGVTARRLPVAAAFHTRFVAHAVEAFRPAVDAVSVAEPQGPVYANSPEAGYGPDVEENRRTLVEQLLKPVEFVAALEAMRSSGCTVFVEFGPKQVLTGLVRRTLGADVVAIATDGGPLGDGDVALKQAAVQLAVLGAPVTGINRFAADHPVEARASGMTVTLSAPEYVSPARREAYENALADGYRVPVAAAPAVRAEPAAGQSEARELAAVAVRPVPAPAAESTPVARHAVPAQGRRDEVSNALQQHITVHGEYLDGQLRIAEQLAASVREGIDPALARAVADQSVAIGQAHTRANEILATLAELELGAPAAGVEAELEALISTAPAANLPAAPAWPSTPAPNGIAVPAPAAAPSGIAAAPAPAPAPAGIAVQAAAPSPNGAASDNAPAPVRAVLLEIVAEKTGYPVEMIDSGMDLEADLGVDSIKRVQVLGAVQERIPGLPEVGPEQLGELRTLDQIVSYLDISVPVAPAAPAAPVAGVRAVLLEIVAEKTGYPVEMIDSGMDLEADLGVDSIKRVQVLGAVQERIPGLPQVGPEQLGELRTLDQIVAYLEGAGDAAPKAPDAGAAGHPADAPGRPERATAPRHRIALHALPPIDRRHSAFPENPAANVVEIGADGTDLRQALERHGWTITTGPADLVLTIIGTSDDWARGTENLTEALFAAQRAIAGLAAGTHRKAFVTVTRLDGGLGLHGTRGITENLIGGAGGIVKTLAAEQPHLFCRAIDVAPDHPDLAAAVLAELHDAATDVLEVGIAADGTRHTIAPGRYRPSPDQSTIDTANPLTKLVVGSDDLLVVTGGARGVTALCVRELAKHSDASFLLLGRTEPAPEPDWARDATDLKAAVILALKATGTPTPREVTRLHNEILAQREIRDTLAELGDRADYLAVDVTDAAAVREALAPHRGSITGFVHGAGVLADALLTTKTRDQVDRVFRTKLAGADAVLAALDGAPLRHLVFFTSVAGLLGNAGQADYAAANEALCRVAAAYRHHHPHVQAVAIDWGAWDGGMVTPELRELFADRGVPLLDPRAGARAFAEQFTPDREGDTCVLVGADVSLTGDRDAAKPAFTAHRDLGGLPDDPVIQAHRIGSDLVLPATYGLGWLIAVLERAHPGRRVIGVRDFQVHKGIVFDGAGGDFRVEAGAGTVDGDQVVVRAAVRSGERTSHYAAEFVLATTTPAAPVLDPWRTGDGPEDALAIYREATQFHGPRLQGMRQVLERQPARLVLQCRLDDAEPGGFHGHLHSPVLADVLLQGPPVLGKDLLGQACLPLGIGRADYFAPLPNGEPFVLVLDDVRPGPSTVTVTATACAPDGVVLQRFADVTVVSTPDMSGKFRESVQTWIEETQ